MSNCPACQTVNPAGARLCTKCGAVLGLAPLRFIGRKKELAALQAAVGRIRARGQGELLLVTGAAGIGKTWVCREIGRRCRADGMRFAASACLPSAQALPLWPIRRLLRARLAIHAATPAGDARRLATAALDALAAPLESGLLPRWLEFVGAADDRSTLPPQGPGVRRRLLDLAAAVLLNSPKGQVLLVEDLQWADPGSMEFLLKLARDVGAAGPTVLLLSQDAKEAHAGTGAVQALPATRLELGGFNGEELRQLTGAWLGSHSSLREVARHIEQRSGGNPFFLEHAVRDLEQGGALRGTRGAYEWARADGDWPLPDTAQALLAARIDRLPAEHKNLLQAAAVAEQDCTLPMLCELTGAALREVVLRVQALDDAGFLQRADAEAHGPGNASGRPSTALVAGAEYVELALAHALVREAACRTLPDSRRQTLHARVADWLERAFPQTAPPCEQWITISRHWEASGQWARAGAWNLAAAQWAARWDLNLMLAQVRAAIANLDRGGAVPGTAEKRIAARATLIRMAEHTPIPGHEVEQAYLQGRDLAKTTEDAEGHSQLLLSYGVHCLHRGDADFAAERAEQAARLLLAAVGAAGAAGRSREADESFTDYVLHIHNTAGRLQEGLALAGELAGRNWTAAPMSARNHLARAEHAVALTYQGRLQQARGELDAVLGFAADDDNTTAWVHGFLVDHAVLSGDTTQALQHAQRAVQRAEAFGSAYYRAWAVRALGAARCLLNRHADAVAPLEQARPLFADDSSGHIFEGVYFATLAESYRGSGHPKKAAEAAEAGIAAARRACARIQELQAWTVFLSLPREGPWASRVPQGLTRMQELMTFTGASAFLPWWCQSQARWAPDIKARHHWLRQTVDAFTQMGATPHVNRLTQAG